MKQITQDQINALLQRMYQTNMSAQIFDAVKKMLSELPEVKSVEKVAEKNGEKKV